MRARRFSLDAACVQPAAAAGMASCQRSASLYSFLHCSATSGGTKLTAERGKQAWLPEGGSGVAWRPLFSLACHRCRAECAREKKTSRWTLQLLLHGTSVSSNQIRNIQARGAVCASGARDPVVGGILAPDACVKSPSRALLWHSAII